MTVVDKLPCLGQPALTKMGSYQSIQIVTAWPHILQGRVPGSPCTRATHQVHCRWPVPFEQLRNWDLGGGDWARTMGVCYPFLVTVAKPLQGPRSYMSSGVDT